MTARMKRRVFGACLIISAVAVAYTLPSEEERFVTAIQNGDAATVSDLLNKRSELAQLELPVKGGGGTPVLQMALSRGTNEIVRLLLTHGATPDKYRRILFYASNPEAAQLLLDRGVNVNQQGADGDAALHFFAAIPDASMARFVIEHGADVNIRNNGGETPLHRAAREGNLDASKLLVARGAEVGARSKQNKTPLDLAVQAVWNEDWYGLSLDRIRRGKEVGAYLLSCGATGTVSDMAWIGDVTRLVKALATDPSLVNARANGESVLFAAVRGGSADAVEHLLTQGAQLDATGRFQQTPLQVAAYIGHSEVAKTLLDHGAAVDARGRWGETALHWAAFRGHADVVALLLIRGADPNIQAGGHRVDLNVTANDASSIERELKWFATLEDQRRRGGQIIQRPRLAFTAGDTPLHVAAYWGHPDIVKLLAARGADVNKSDHWGAVALHLAVASAYEEGGRRESVSDYVDIVQQLLAAGADPLVKTPDGFTAVDLARQIGNNELVQLLTSRKRP